MSIFIVSNLFYFFSFFMLVSAILVISAKNPVHSVLFLILVFCNAAGLLILLEVEFLAVLFLIVYVGAIAVLFLFVVMMLNIKLVELSASSMYYLPLGLCLAIIFLSELFIIVDTDLIPLFFFEFADTIFFAEWLLDATESSNVSRLGDIIYTDFVLLFLMSGLILFIAMIGTIMLTLYRNENIKRQIISKQISRDFNKTIKLIYIR